MVTDSERQFGPYKLLDRIGSGGMGEVYRALDTRLEREVAIKLVSESFLAENASSSPSSGPAGTPHSPSQRSHERFLREARAAATLNHPNICAIYDTGEQAGRPYLVMELLTGETLKQYLRSGGEEHALSPEEAVAFGVQIANALAAAHARGIVHRDIKPANLFVTTGDRGRKQIKVLDFGLAKQQGAELTDSSRTVDADRTSDASGLDLTSPGSAVGTVSYMSPEQAKGEKLDARTDLFSLGVVIYEMATGKLPFAGNSPAEVFAQLLTKDPSPVSQVNPAMPRGLDPIVAKLLAKDATHRYANAQELCADLETLQEASRSTTGSRPTVTAVPLPLPERNSRRTLRNVAAVAVLLTAVGFVAWQRAHKKPDASPSSAASPAAPSANAKDQIILADFVNKTGDPVFDTTLNQALRVQLGQSPVLDIVSAQHLRQSLQFLGKKSEESISPAVAREIGEREGMKAILTGSIASVGSSYVVTLNAQNTATGDDIATTQATAKDKNAVLDALNQTATEMRAKLGESLASIKKLNTPFGQATTPSLEAFRAYALGDEAHQRGDDVPDAEAHYKRALELDPNLAMAWARLGVIYINAGENTKAIEYFTKAHSLTANVSERERLYIDGHYYEVVQGDLDKTIETLQIATQEYPLQLDNFINLSVAYLIDAQLEKSQDTLERAVALQPDDAVALEDIISSSVGLDRFEEATRYSDRAEKLNLKGISLLSYKSVVPAAWKDDWSKMDAALGLIQSREDGFQTALVLGRPYANFGKIERARQIIRDGVDKAATEQAKDAQAQLLLVGAAIGWELDDCRDVKETVKQALELDKGPQTLNAVASTLALCGDAASASTTLDGLLKQYPNDTMLHGFIAPMVNGYVGLQTGDAARALKYGEQARRYDAFAYPAYLRGVAHMKLNQPAAAAADFEIASRYKGSGFTGQANATPWAFFKLQAGRAYAAAGDKVNAKKNYDLFFANWKAADPGLKVTAEAKQEYARLQ